MHRCCLVFFLLLLVATTWAGELRCLRPGAPVISLYKESRYFPGRVDGLGDSIDVTFRNGQQQTYNSFTNDVVVDDIPDPGELTGGSRVLARRPSSTSFEPGFVNGSIEGLPMNDTFLVNFDTGDSIARNIEDIRLAVKPRSCMNEKGIYIGCFLNVVNNFLTNYYPVNPTDVATCNWACFQRGFRFAGLQNGTWCFCGNNVNDSLKVDDNDCNIACRDSRQDVCGGYQRMTVYWTGADFDNQTSDLSEFADATGQLTPQQDDFKSESSSESQCSDLHDSVQCNTWADQSKCIENPDWMIANCKKSCYACSYNDRGQDTTDKPDSSLQAYAPVASAPAQSQPNPYQAPTQSGYQASSSYAQNSYSTSQDASAQSSSKKSDHPVLDNTRNTAGYLGCFTDSPSSHDLEYLADIRPLSIRACVTKCKSMRFPYAGVQSSSSCYCGLHYGKYGQLEHEDCNTPCEADSSEMCGGLFKNSLYHTGFPVKFKSAENVNRRNPSSESNMATGQAYPPNSYNNYVSQSSQPSYPQPNLGYSPPAYPPPASPYTRAAMPGQSGYPQTTNTQTNGYPPAYSYNNQASRPAQSGTSTANADTRDNSPVDSSSYRWRETYVKLRQQEQERYSKPSLKNLWKLHRTENTWPKQFLEKAKLKDSLKLKNLGNNAKSTGRTHSVKSTKNLSSQSKNYSPEKSAALYNQLISHVYKNSMKGKSHGDKKILRKGGKRHSGKPGVFLRKKASKKSSFLAFLPHEVTEDESLLENVYDMLSVMLKNLRKHKRNSLKNLKKYLQFSENEEKVSKFARKAPLHSPQYKESVARPEKPVEKKFDGTKDSRPSHHAKNHLSKGQKQLSKQRNEISNSQKPVTQTMTYASRGVSHVKQNVNQSFITSGNPGDSHHTSSHNTASHHTSSHHTSSHHTTSHHTAGHHTTFHHSTSPTKPAILNKETQSFTNIVQPHNDVGKLSESPLSKNTSSNNKLPYSVKQSGTHSMSSEVHRNMAEEVPKTPKNDYHTKSMVSESKSEDHQTLSKVIQKASVDYKNVSSKRKTMLENQVNMTRIHGDTAAHSRQVPSKLEKFGDFSHHYNNRENDFENQSSRKNTSLDGGQENSVKPFSPATKYTKATLKKLSKEKLPIFETEDKAVLNIDTPMANNQTADEDMAGTSDDDIISTIVDLLDKEKAMREIKHKDEQRKQNGSETKQPNSKHGKRKKKRHNKKEKRKKRKKKRKKKGKHKLKGKNRNSSKRYKKDRLARVRDAQRENDDENLMEEAEDFREEMG